MWQRQLDGRVKQDAVLLGQPFEPGPQRGEAAELSADGERRAVGLAVVEQVALIALQDRPGDLARIGQPSLVAPGDEPPQRDAPAAHRVLGVAGDQHPFEVRLHRLGQWQVRQLVGLLAGPPGAPAGLAEPLPPCGHGAVSPAGRLKAKRL